MRKIFKKIKCALVLFNYYALSFVTLNEKKIVIPNIYKHKIDLGDLVSEKWLECVISKIINSEAGAFIDVGVNLGQTLIKVKSAKIDQDYYGFEPNPACHYLLEELIKCNNFINCTLIPLGLSNENGILTLITRDQVDGSGTLVSNFRDDGNKVFSQKKFVSVFTGDLVLNSLNINSLALIKIDVEGGELEVIQGLKISISRFRPYILCEILPTYDGSSGSNRLRKERQEELLALLRSLSYYFCRILRDGRVVLLDKIEAHADMNLRDYIFIPYEKKELARKLLQIET